MSQRPLDVPGGMPPGGNGSGNGNGQGPPNITTCPPCQQFADKVNNLNADITSLQELLHTAPSAAKPGILRQIEEKNGELDTAQGELDQCEQQNCPPLQTVVGTLDVTQTEIWTDNPQLPPIISPGGDLILTLTFVGNPGAVWTVTRLDLTPFSIQGGKIAIKNFTGGHFDPASGSMDLNVELRAHIDDPLGGQDSDVVLAFTTGTVQTAFTLPFGGNVLTGTPFDKQLQQIQLVAAGQFSGGHLDKTNMGISFVVANAQNWPQN